MRRQRQTVKIECTDSEMIGIFYFDDPKRSSYLHWEIPMNEADSLVRWWAVEGSQIRKNKLPVREHKFGSVLISMFTCSGSVHLKGFGPYGELKMLGYSLPRTVVKHLWAWLQDNYAAHDN